MTDLPLVGRGRAADVFDVGEGRVLRRYRTPQPGAVEREARAMQYLHSQGAPVPEVFFAEGSDIVMERLTGPTLLDVLGAHPWRAAAIGRQLSALQRSLHDIHAGDIDLPRLGSGTSILHLDLHPDNVIVTPTGPRVIDWTNVAVGEPLADVVNTWMLMSIGTPPRMPRVVAPLLRRVRRALTDGFMEGTVLDDSSRRWVTEICARRLRDPNTLDGERSRVNAFAATYGAAIK